MGCWAVRQSCGAEHELHRSVLNPRAVQWKVGVDREFARDIIAGIDYTYISTTKITRQRDINLRHRWPMRPAA